MPQETVYTLLASNDRIDIKNCPACGNDHNGSVLLRTLGSVTQSVSSSPSTHMRCPATDDTIHLHKGIVPAHTVLRRTKCGCRPAATTVSVQVWSNDEPMITVECDECCHCIDAWDLQGDKFQKLPDIDTLPSALQESIDAFQACEQGELDFIAFGDKDSPQYDLGSGTLAKVDANNAIQKKLATAACKSLVGAPEQSQKLVDDQRQVAQLTKWTDPSISYAPQPLSQGRYTMRTLAQVSESLGVTNLGIRFSEDPSASIMIVDAWGSSWEVEPQGKFYSVEYVGKRVTISGNSNYIEKELGLTAGYLGGWKDPNLVVSAIDAGGNFWDIHASNPKLSSPPFFKAVRVKDSEIVKWDKDNDDSLFQSASEAYNELQYCDRPTFDFRKSTLPVCKKSEPKATATLAEAKAMMRALTDGYVYAPYVPIIRRDPMDKVPYTISQVEVKPIVLSKSIPEIFYRDYNYGEDKETEAAPAITDQYSNED